MNQEKTKHKFHEVLRWIADNETIEYKHPSGGKTFETIPTKQVLEFLAKDNFSHVPANCFRIKPKPQVVRADVTYISFGTFGNCTVDLNCENTDATQSLYKMAQQRERVVILTEQCYNDLLGNSTLNLKGN